MSKIYQLTYWEIRKRIDILQKTRQLIVEYFNAIVPGSYSHNDTRRSRAIRSKINLRANQITRYILEAGESHILDYTPPPVTGGFRQPIDMVANMFSFTRYGISPDILLDVIDRTVGQYQSYFVYSIFNSINPFWWLWKIIVYLSRAPLIFINSIGFVEKDIENTIYGKIIKSLIQVILVIAAIVKVLDYVGVSFDKIQKLIK